MVEVVGGASVASKGHLPTSMRALQAKGNRVLLEDDGWYVDWPMGLHGAIYGYAPAWWIDAFQRVQTATIPRRDELVVAEMLGLFYPDIEAVRFMCTGSDPCAAAVKLVRAVTGRDKILVYGYHGSASAFCTPPRVSGVEKRGGTLQAERDAFVPLEWLCPYDSQTWQGVAAVIVEVPSEDTPSNWLMNLARAAHEVGALFILDEVKTAFRYGPAGAAGAYNLLGLTDLYCFGKTLGNGYPVSCLAGKKAAMDELTGAVHYSGTFFGEPIGLSLAKATLTRLRTNPPWDHLYEVGTYLKDRWNQVFPPYEMTGHPTRPELGHNIWQSKLFQYGHITMSSPWYITTATTKDDVNALAEVPNEP